MVSAIFVGPTAAFAQDQTAEAATEALEQAKAARAEALQALQKADEALARAERMLAASTDGTTPTAVPTPDSISETIDKALCFDASCDSDETLSAFAKDQLGLARIADYKNSAELGFFIQGGKEGQYASLGPVFVNRALIRIDGEQYRSRVDRFGIKGFASIAEDNSITLGSWSAGDGLSGNSDWALGLDWRRSWMAPRQLKDGRDRLAKMLETISRDCAVGLGKPYTPSLHSDSDCREWIADDKDRQNKYFGKYVAQFWGIGDDGKEQIPEFYLGAQGKYGFLRESFYALRDPAGTGVTILPALPTDLNNNALTKESFNPAEFKLYAGHALVTFDDNGWDLGIAGSLGWQRSVRYPKDAEDVSVCYEDTNVENPTFGFSKCKKINLAAPYETDGVLIGAGFNVRPPRTLVGRPYMGLFGSYDTAVDQWTASLPIAFAIDGDGTLKAGLKITYTSDGETFYGENIPAKGNIGVFLEHDLTFPFVP
ncbi:hypothetical protein [Qipengyuania gelatinilytica]|uniref:Carbohydrate porin n=1 Tax=Qipengyuania gelatinilytica TaxID=2867231 RepID=A0ABX9A5J3_9SPHN|nr:hypothetical protein [Qipengyuania gelatinilytica]QZD95584.1 hypothetical protein K3136_02320 [Qipengyuania gelatinilytica]